VRHAASTWSVPGIRLICFIESSILSLNGRSYVVMETPFVHPSAIVEQGAVVGAGSKIWHHSHLRQGAVIGTSCSLGKNVFVDADVTIGDRVKIQNNVSLYRGVDVADGVFIGPSVVFTNDLRPRADRALREVITTHVRRGASVGANATVVCGVEIGEHAMVGAGAVVTKSVKPHQMVYGNPARHHAWVCGCGEVVSRTPSPPSDVRCALCRENVVSSPTSCARHLPRIPLAKVEMGPEEQEAVLGVLRSGRLAAGERVRELEASFSRAHEARHAIAVSSGTAALTAALRAHGIGSGDEVITSPLTFGATLNAILEVGATARFGDVADDFTLDPERLTRLLNSRTRALLPVHLYGLPADMDPIRSLASSRGLVVIEDAAQAHGARVGAAPVGSAGTAMFSFYGTKNITCGEGGIVTTDDDQIAGRLRLLRNQGMRDAYDYVMPGYNYRLTDLQAAIITVQLKRLPAINRSRRNHAARLSAGLSGIRGLVLPVTPAGREHVWHQYTVRVTPEARMDRDQLRKCLDTAGVDSRPYYPRLVHDYDCYRNHPQVIADETPRARQAVREVLSIPVHPALTDADLSWIISVIQEGLGSQLR
jgi:dTDP-4-amino-4,6-dideoxygalactose transaminase/acetyltransferase-like isoleucine patch superfamily enzyme